ncbi:TonB-dependent receptor [Gilvimarinus sp. F26214L]|uniref:TonB-dependent receptor n=1 Tax=Gilvimarinus sp. DZF01 TaxID=3461371 RepID=UPI0040455E5E
MKITSIQANLSVSVACLAALGAIPSFAQPADGAYIEEVVVTARRRTENMQDVPVAVSAFTADALERRGVTDITELQQQVPNTTLQVSRGTNTTLTAYIRGIGQQDPLWGFEPGVGIYIDDVYVARPQGAVLDILDLENVEVLRGPQGTLYGKNTIGGAVKYQTRTLGNDPSFHFTGRAGSYNQRDVLVSGSLPLIEDKLFIGGGAATLKRDGFGEFRNTGDDNYNKDVTTGHVKVQWNAADNLQVTLSGDKTEDNGNPRGGYRLTPSLVTGQQPYNDVYDSDISLSGDNEVTTQGASLRLAWQIDDALELKSITASREGDTYTSIDFDATAEPSFDVPAVYDDEQFTQEFQVSYSGDQLSMVGGLYYFEGDACGAFGVVLGLVGVTAENGGCVHTESYSAYAQASYDFSNALSVTVGGRYTDDVKDADVYRYVFAGTKLPNQYAVPAAIQSDFSGEEDWAEFSPHVGVQYRFNDDVMAYGSYTSGFKSGGFDMRADQSLNPSAHEPFDPEIVDSYEVGLKSTLLDSRLRLNAALFYNDYTDMQITVQRAVGVGTYVSQVINAGESKMKGLELEAVAALTERLNLTAMIGYIDAEFVTVDTYDPVQRKVVDVSDEWVISNTPEWTANLGLSYSADIAGWQSEWRVGAVYRDGMHIFEVPSALDEGSYTLLNADLVFTSPGGNWLLGLHGKNLGNEEYRIAGYNFPASFDSDGTVTEPGLGGEDTVTAFYGDPRTVMLSVGYQF